MIRCTYSSMKSFAVAALSTAIFTLATGCGGNEIARQGVAPIAVSEVKASNPRALEVPGDASAS